MKLSSRYSWALCTSYFPMLSISRETFLKSRFILIFIFPKLIKWFVGCSFNMNVSEFQEFYNLIGPYEC